MATDKVQAEFDSQADAAINAANEEFTKHSSEAPTDFANEQTGFKGPSAEAGDPEAGGGKPEGGSDADDGKTQDDPKPWDKPLQEVQQALANEKKRSTKLEEQIAKLTTPKKTGGKPDGTNDDEDDEIPDDIPDYLDPDQHAALTRQLAKRVKSQDVELKEFRAERQERQVAERKESSKAIYAEVGKEHKLGPVGRNELTKRIEAEVEEREYGKDGQPFPSETVLRDLAELTALRIVKELGAAATDTGGGKTGKTDTKTADDTGKGGARTNRKPGLKRGTLKEVLGQQTARGVVG